MTAGTSGHLFLIATRDGGKSAEGVAMTLATADLIPPSRHDIERGHVGGVSSQHANRVTLARGLLEAVVDSKGFRTLGGVCSGITHRGCKRTA